MSVKEAGLNSAISVDRLLGPCSACMPGDWPRAIGVAIWAFNLPGRGATKEDDGSDYA